MCLKLYWCVIVICFWVRKWLQASLDYHLLFSDLVSAAFKVVTSCFRDAIPLTPWQSFSKDLIYWY
ncbi:hypothetical protein CS542_04885 [Pedobacter sp. IW39]|nr:hypothetical protein CS542_04885 [Pedobacter sp. IW39]